MKWNDFEFSSGNYEDVNRVYKSLSDEEKNLVTPGRRIYKDIPKALSARTVAYSDEKPVGFVDIYGPYGDVKHPNDRPFYTFETAVCANHRGVGLSPAMTRETIRKVVRQIISNRKDAHSRGLNVENEPDEFRWIFMRGNEKSERAAIAAGLKKKRRQIYTLGIDDAIRKYWGEKKAGSKIDIQKLYDAIKKRYREMGYEISGDRLFISSHPSYANGKPVPASVLKPNVSGGDAQDDGTIRINPNYRSVMRHWNLKGSGRDFLNTIIGHELGHHIDRTLLRGTSRSKQELRDRLLDEIRRKRFHTIYTDSYDKATTDPRKLDKELIAEYLSSIVNDKS